MLWVREHNLGPAKALSVSGLIAVVSFPRKGNIGRLRVGPERQGFRSLLVWHPAFYLIASRSLGLRRVPCELDVYILFALSH